MAQQQQSNMVKPQTIGGAKQPFLGGAKPSLYVLPKTMKNAYWMPSGGKARQKLAKLNANDKNIQNPGKSLKSKTPAGLKRKAQPTLHQVQKSISKTMGKTF